jgi:hypothetical protein
MKSVKAVLAGLMKNRTCITPMARLVTPMGTTSDIHQVAASRKMAMAPLPWTLREKDFPVGSTASGHSGE